MIQASAVGRQMRVAGWAGARPGAAAALVALCAALLLVGVCAGSSGWIAPDQALARLIDGDDIVAGLRAPRVLLSGVVGASLALAGVAMQALLHNHLADPYVLGLSGGASLGAVTSLALLPGLPAGPAAAGGAAVAVALVQGLARGTGDPVRQLLAGVAVGAVLASLSGLVVVLAPAERLLRAATFWMFGGFGTPAAATLSVPALLLVAAVVWLRVRGFPLDRLSLGDDVAASLGVPVRALRRETLVVAVLLTACSVAVGGLIGFVGLIAPHAARRLVGAGHRALAPIVALLGAALVMGADLAARTAFAPREVPVGLVTALCGGPFFLWLLRRVPRWT